MAGEALARPLADVPGPFGHVMGDGVEPIHRHDERALAEHVDARSQPHLGRCDRHPVEGGLDRVGIGVTEEAQRDVPALGVDETHPALVLAGKGEQLGHHVLGRPHSDEESGHRQAATGRTGVAHDGRARRAYRRSLS